MKIMSNLPRLEKLKMKQAKLSAQIQAVEAREKFHERKKETRRKILLGSYYLEQFRQHNKTERLKEIMRNYLTRDSDRQLFDLPKMDSSEKKLSPVSSNLAVGVSSDLVELNS
jgi:large subunit ribosomal protein L7/L12